MKRVLALDSSLSYARILMAKAYLGLGDTVSAINGYQTFVLSSFEPAEGFLELGYIFTSKGLNDSAYYYYKKSYEANNNYPQANYQIALYFFNKILLTDALEFISRAIENEGNNLDFRNLRRHIYIKQNRQDLADEEYIFIKNNDSDFFGNYKEKAEQENNAGNYQSAVENYKLALLEQPDKKELLEACAWVYHSLFKYDSAFLYFERVVQLYPDYLSYFNLAYTLDLMNKVDESISNYNKSIELKQDYYLSYNNRGYEQYKLKKFKMAESDYSKSIELKSDYYLSYYNRGLLYYGLKNYENAIEDYQKALNYADNTLYINYSLALAYDDMKNSEKAINSYNEFIKSAGESDSVRIGYATERISKLTK
jgi:tetratricopeptide (TPR) repeat protein